MTKRRKTEENEKRKERDKIERKRKLESSSSSSSCRRRHSAHLFSRIFSLLLCCSSIIFQANSHSFSPGFLVRFDINWNTEIVPVSSIFHACQSDGEQLETRRKLGWKLGKEVVTWKIDDGN